MCGQGEPPVTAPVTGSHQQLPTAFRSGPRLQLPVLRAQERPCHAAAAAGLPRRSKPECGDALLRGGSVAASVLGDHLGFPRAVTRGRTRRRGAAAARRVRSSRRARGEAAIARCAALHRAWEAAAASVAIRRTSAATHRAEQRGMAPGGARAEAPAATARVAVIGGGLSGLYAARMLHEHLPPSNQRGGLYEGVLVLEAAQRLGGRCVGACRPRSRGALFLRAAGAQRGGPGAVRGGGGRGVRARRGALAAAAAAAARRRRHRGAAVARLLLLQRGGWRRRRRRAAWAHDRPGGSAGGARPRAPCAAPAAACARDGV
eukprot:scaffold1578_cov340-Prasinococcus_capsulatus_cf.AAC.5